MNTLKDRIKDCLVAQDISARAIALQAGITEDSIKNIMRGRSKNPRAETLSKLAKTLNVDPEWLATGKGTPERQGADFYNVPEFTLPEETPSKTRPFPNWFSHLLGVPIEKMTYIQQGSTQFLVDKTETSLALSGHYVLKVNDSYDLFHLRVLPDETVYIRPLTDLTEHFILPKSKLILLGRIIWQGTRL